MEEFVLVDSRRHDFYILENEACDELLKDHGPYAYSVYGFLVRHANRETSISSRGTGTIADGTKIGRTKVKEMLHLLDTEGWVSITPRKDDLNRDIPPLYTILDRRGRGRQATPSGHQAAGRGSHAATIQEEVPSTNVEDATNGGDLFKIFCNRMKVMQLDVTSEDRKIIPRNLKLVAEKEDAGTVNEVINTMIVSRQRGYADSPQDALRFLRRGGKARERHAGPSFDEIPEM